MITNYLAKKVKTESDSPLLYSKMPDFALAGGSTLDADSVDGKPGDDSDWGKLLHLSFLFFPCTE